MKKLHREGREDVRRGGETRGREERAGGRQREERSGKRVGAGALWQHGAEFRFED